jgi:hypothetical protein
MDNNYKNIAINGARVELYAIDNRGISKSLRDCQYTLINAYYSREQTTPLISSQAGSFKFGQRICRKSCSGGGCGQCDVYDELTGPASPYKCDPDLLLKDDAIIINGPDCHYYWELRVSKDGYYTKTISFNDADESRLSNGDYTNRNVYLDPKPPTIITPTPTPSVTPSPGVTPSPTPGVTPSPSPTPTPTATSYFPSTPDVDYEKGSGDAVVRFSVARSAGQPACDRIAPLQNDVITWYASGVNNGVAFNDGPFTTRSINCNAAALTTTDRFGTVLANNTYIKSISSADLNSSPVGTFAPEFSTNITSISSGAGSTVINNPSTGHISIYEVPYARFYGNDIYATDATSGGVFFNTNSTAASAVQYASIAFSATNRINTAAFRTSAPVPSEGLRPQLTAGSPRDARDYTSFLPTSATGTLSSSDLSLASTGYYTPSGTATVNGVGINKKVTVKAANIIINSNIETTDPPTPFDNSRTPVVLLISDGDIYINRNVERIDAILMARNGTIYTCANGTSEVLPRGSASGWQTSCNRKLVINGAVGAQDIRFARSIGTRLLGTANEDSSVGGNKLTYTPGGLNTAAEVINFPAYLYFATPYLRDTSTSSYQSLFNAAPLL